MIFWGYFISFAFMLLVILVGEGLQKKFNLDKELVRKVEHLATAFSWIICYFFIGCNYHLVIINGLACLALGIIAFGGLMKSVEREDTAKSYGLFYWGLSTTIIAAITVFVNPKFYPLNGIAYYCLSFGDGFAPIFAKIFKKNNVQVYPPKTLMGMIAVFLFSMLATIVFNIAFSLGYSWHFILSVACLSCLLELFGTYGLDNFYITFGVFGYLILQYYGLVTAPLEFAIIISLFTVFVSAKLDALTHSANIVSVAFLMICAFCTGWSLTTMVLSLYVISAIVSKITSKKYYAKYNKQKKHIARGVLQILTNSSVAAAFAILYYIFKNVIFLYCAIAVIGEEFADSMASDLGRLSNKKPKDILGLREIIPGISGGISWLGTFMAFLGAVIATLIPYAFYTKTISWYIGLIICGIAFSGTFIDSILGSGLQVLYKCLNCNNFVESKIHCDNQAVYVKGVPWITNSMVNFLSGILTAGIACGLFFAII